jgi:hypothetical protein
LNLGQFLIIIEVTMSKTISVDDLNQEILNLWDTEKRESELVPLLYPEFQKGALLVVGLNPSFSTKGIRKNIKDVKRFEHIDNIQEYFLWEKYSIEKYDELIDIEKEAKKKYNYFNRIKDLSECMKLPWEHIDLLCVRDTNQKNIENLIKSDRDFIKKQINITLRLIKRLEPKIILINNAFCSKILKERLDLKINDELGTYLHKSIPVFFSGMLSGQRALDIGSYERLKWHMKFAVNYMEN